MTYSSLYFIYWCTIVTVNLDWMVQVLDRGAVTGTMNVDRRARGTMVQARETNESESEQVSSSFR